MSEQHSSVPRRETLKRQLVTSKEGSVDVLRDGTLLTDVSDGVLYVDENRIIFAANNAAARISGFSKNELKGRLLDALFGRDVAVSICDAASVRNRPIRLQDLTSICRRDGTSSIVQGLARRINLQGSGRIVRLVLRDVTLEQKLQDELQISLQERRQAHEIERMRLSRKLHEEVLQDLLALAINLDALPRSCHGDSANCGARELAVHAREVTNYLRTISHSLRPRILDRMSLVSALRTIVNESRTNSLKSYLDIRGSERPMPWYVESGVYRIALELLSNVRKHSKASEATTTLVFRRKDAVLIVRDNGIGFDHCLDTGVLVNQGRHGIAGIHERVEYLGGTLDIDSRKGGGTKVRVVVPYDSAYARQYSRSVWPSVPEYLPPVVDDSSGG